LQQCKYPSLKHKKPKHLYNKKNYKVKTMLYDAPPNSSRDPKVGPKVKQQKKKRVGAHSPTHNTLGVGKHARDLGWD
jgi:hypothetical protein